MVSAKLTMKDGWHRAEIVAAIHMRGTSLAALARKHGLSDAALRAALSYPRKPSNTIIANFLGYRLHELWPDWFDTNNRLIPAKASRPEVAPSSQKRKAKLTPRRRS